MKYTILAYTDTDKTKLEYSIVFDAVLNISEKYTNTVTAHVVEDGGLINDHVVKSKDKINVEGIVSDLSFNQGDQGLIMFGADGELGSTITEAWSNKTRKALLDIDDRSLPCSIKVSEKVDNQEVIYNETFPCLIEELDLSRTGGQYGFIQPKITFVPVRIVSIEFVQLSAQQEAIPALKNRNTQSTTARTKSGVAGSDGTDEADPNSKEIPLGLTKSPEEEKEKSWLEKIGDYWDGKVKKGIEYEKSTKKALQGTLKQLEEQLAIERSR